MPEYDNNNRGVLFKNKDRKTDRSPLYTGECEIVHPDTGEVIPCWISAWVNQSKKSGENYMSLAFDPKNKPAEPAVDESELPDIPF